MPTIIPPTVGRVVLFTPGAGRDRVPHTKGEPLAGTIAKVWGPNCVNIGFLDADGVHHNATSVRLIQDGDPEPSVGEEHCRWMPYQIGQAASQAGKVDPRPNPSN